MLIWDSRKYFGLTLAFSQADFQPCSAATLLMDVARVYFVQAKNPQCVLNDHHRVGAHTDIYIFEPDTVGARYTWSHSGRQPFGQPTPLQCVGCKSIKSWGRPKVTTTSPAHATAIDLACKLCGYQLKIARPDGFVKFSSGPVDRSERGDWYVQKLE